MSRKDEILALLGLSDYYWRDIPDKTLQTLLRRQGTKKEKQIADALKHYGTHTLEFLVANLVLKRLGLTASPHQLSAILTSFITTIEVSNYSKILGLCRRYFYKHIHVNSLCATFFRGFVGLLFVHGYKKEGMCVMGRLENWFESLLPVIELLDEISYKVDDFSANPEEITDEQMDEIIRGIPRPSLSHLPHQVVYSKRTDNYYTLLKKAFMTFNLPTIDYEYIEGILTIPFPLDPVISGISLNNNKEEANKDLLETLIKYDYITVVNRGGPRVDGDTRR